MNERRLYLSRDKLIGGVAGRARRVFRTRPHYRAAAVCPRPLGPWRYHRPVHRRHDYYPRTPRWGLRSTQPRDERVSTTLRRAAQGLTEGNNLTGLGILLIGLGVILLLRLFVAVDRALYCPYCLSWPEQRCCSAAGAAAPNQPCSFG